MAPRGSTVIEFHGVMSKPSDTAAIPMPARSVEQFRLHLLEQVPDAAKAGMQAQNHAGAAAANSLRELWEKSDLPAGRLADEAARFWKLRRLNLQDLVNATGAVERFSARFLRESAVFPFRTEKGGLGLAVSDPADAATIRAVEIVCGSTVEVAVASFDDIATVLQRHFDERSAIAEDLDEPEHRSSEDDIESLRDLASGAPVVRAVNDLLERAMEWRATDIHIEPFRNGLTVRMRVDGLLRTVPTPAGVLPQAILSR